MRRGEKHEKHTSGSLAVLELAFGLGEVFAERKIIQAKRHSQHSENDVDATALPDFRAAVSLCFLFFLFRCTQIQNAVGRFGGARAVARRSEWGVGFVRGGGRRFGRRKR
jgi:hypothetical protein